MGKVKRVSGRTECKRVSFRIDDSRGEVFPRSSNDTEEYVGSVDERIDYQEIHPERVLRWVMEAFANDILALAESKSYLQYGKCRLITSIVSLSEDMVMALSPDMIDTFLEDEEETTGQTHATESNVEEHVRETLEKSFKELLILNEFKAREEDDVAYDSLHSSVESSVCSDMSIDSLEDQNGIISDSVLRLKMQEFAQDILDLAESKPYLEYRRCLWLTSIIFLSEEVLIALSSNVLSTGLTNEKKTAGQTCETELKAEDCIRECLEASLQEILQSIELEEHEGDDFACDSSEVHIQSSTLNSLLKSSISSEMSKDSLEDQTHTAESTREKNVPELSDQTWKELIHLNAIKVAQCIEKAAKLLQDSSYVSYDSSDTSSESSIGYGMSEDSLNYQDLTPEQVLYSPKDDTVRDLLELDIPKEYDPSMIETTIFASSMSSFKSIDLLENQDLSPERVFHWQMENSARDVLELDVSQAHETTDTDLEDEMETREQVRTPDAEPQWKLNDFENEIKEMVAQEMGPEDKNWHWITSTAELATEIAQNMSSNMMTAVCVDAYTTPGQLTAAESMQQNSAEKSKVLSPTDTDPEEFVSSSFQREEDFKSDLLKTKKVSTFDSDPEENASARTSITCYQSEDEPERMTPVSFENTLSSPKDLGQIPHKTTMSSNPSLSCEVTADGIITKQNRHTQRPVLRNAIDVMADMMLPRTNRNSTRPLPERKAAPDKMIAKSVKCVGKIMKGFTFLFPCEIFNFTTCLGSKLS